MTRREDRDETHACSPMREIDEEFILASLSPFVRAVACEGDCKCIRVRARVEMTT